MAYSDDRFSIEEPLARFREALRGRDFDEVRKVVHELYEARLNRTLWQIVYEFDRERAEAALEHLRERYGGPEGRLWERHDGLYLRWLAFRLADEFEAYLRSGAGREFKTKEEFGELLALGRWLPVGLTPLFWLRLVGDAEGEVEFRAAWFTAVDMWFERMAAPHTPKKPAVARKAVELFNVFVGAGFKYEELLPPPPPPKLAEAQKPEAAKPAEAKREAVKPETVVKPETAAKPEIKPARPAQKPAVEVQRLEERGLGRDAEKPAVKPEAVKPTAETRPEVVKPETAKPEVVKPAEVKPAEVKRVEAVKPEVVKPAAEAVDGLRRGEKPRAPIADVIPERVESVDYLLERFGFALDREAAFKAKSLVTAKVKTRLEKAAVKEPEFAHILAEVAEHVLSSFGRLMASPDAARHVHEALFYYFEGYQTRDGEVLFARIERTVREAVRKAEEAGIPDADYRIKQFVLEVIDILAKAVERYRRDALKGLSTVEKALRATAFAGLSTAVLYSVYHGLYSEAVVSSVASAVALAEVGQFREAVQYVQRAAKALYEAAKEVFEHVKITVQRLVELFVEAVAKVLAWIDEHKAHLFLMAAVAAGVVALSVALNLWGLAELDKLAYAASLTPFIPAGVEKYSREEAFNILKNAPDPYEKFKKIAKAANAGGMRLAEPWESLRGLIMPKRSEEERLMRGWGAELYSKYREDENYRRALFYAMLALEEAFGVYRSALRKYAEGLKDTVQRMEAGEKPFKKVVYAADLKQIKQLAEEGKAFEKALDILRTRLNEYAVGHGLRDLLDVNEEVARRLAEAKHPELSEFNDVSFGTKAYAALIAYREHALGRRGAFGTAAEHWLEVGGSAWLLYYTPITAHQNAEKTKAEKPVAVEEVVAEALRRLLLRPGADHYSRFVELLGSGKLALELKKKTKSSYLFKLYRLEEGDGLVELGIKLRIKKVREGIVYHLGLEIKRWLGFFKQELEAAEKAAEEVEKRLPVEDRFSYMVGWVRSDVAVTRMWKKRVLYMGTSHLWLLAETHALFGWYVKRFRMPLTLEGPKLVVDVETSLENLDDAIRRSAEGGWLKMLDINARSWDNLKQRIKENWGLVVDAAVSRLRKVLKEEELEKLLAPKGRDAPEGRKGRQAAPRDKQIDGVNVWEVLRRRLEALRDKLDDDKIAREVIAPALLLIQAEKLGVNEETLRYFSAVISGAVDGDGYVSAVRKEVGLTSGKLEVALLEAAALAAHGIKAKVRVAGKTPRVLAFGGDAVRLAGLYFLYGAHPLEGDDRLKSHKLAGAVELAAEGLDIRWEGLRRRTEDSPVAADLIISAGGAAVKYNVYLRENAIELRFQSTDRSRAELAACLLRLAGVDAEVKKEEVGGRDKWRVRAHTDKLAGGHEKLRKALAEIVRKAMENRWVYADKAERWLEKLERGRVLREGQPKYYVGLKEGALEVRFSSTNPVSIEREVQWLEKRGLKRGVHFSVKTPEGGKAGYVSILSEGLAYAAYLSVRGKDEQQRRLAAEFVEYILQRAGEEGKDVYSKAEEIVKEGKERGSLTLKGFVKEFEVDGRRHVVKVIDGGAEFDKGKGGRKLLRIRISAEVDGVRREYEITYRRRGRNNAAVGSAVARGNAPKDREADAERLAAVIEALTGKRPKVYRKKNGQIVIECGREHLDSFMRYAELADAIMRWLEETGRR